MEMVLLGKREFIIKKLEVVAFAMIILLLCGSMGLSTCPVQQSNGNETLRETNAATGSLAAQINDTGSLGENASMLSYASSSGIGSDIGPRVAVGPVQEEAELYSPIGTITTGRPTYVWKKVADVEFYCLKVEDLSGKVVINLCFDANDLQDLDLDSKLSVVAPVTLAAGTYQWQIRTCICNEEPSESGKKRFTVCTSTSLPGKTTLLLPKNTIGYEEPIYSWQSVPGATRYRLQVAIANDLGNPILDEWYDASEITSDKGCSIRPDEPLNSGTSYKWRVQTGSCLGDGPWTSYLSFRVTALPPGIVTAKSPTGLISTRTPTFVWTATSTATEYHLQVENDTMVILDEWYLAEDVTRGYICSAFSPAILSDDADFYWRVQASNDVGPGPWSSLKYFEVVCNSANQASIKGTQDRARSIQSARNAPRA
jgi:large repetitive protein